MELSDDPAERDTATTWRMTLEVFMTVVAVLLQVRACCLLRAACCLLRVNVALTCYSDLQLAELCHRCAGAGYERRIGGRRVTVQRPGRPPNAARGVRADAACFVYTCWRLIDPSL